jgi:hypothetical protein
MFVRFLVRVTGRTVEEKREAMSPMALYLPSGKVPTGRTAEILREAERGRRRREANGG